MLILITRTDNLSNKYNPGLEITFLFLFFFLLVKAEVGEMRHKLVYEMRQLPPATGCRFAA